MALIVYNESRVERSLELPFRFFRFFGRDLKILQKWLPDGQGGTKIGFGASVYDCSYILASYLENYGDIVLNKTVIEFGCGPGLTSIVAALAGSSRVICTDGDPQSVHLANENIGLNLSNSILCKGQILLWDNEDHIKEAIKSNDHNLYDVAIASDVAALPYVEFFDQLINTLLQLVKPDGVVYLSYQRRHIEEDLFFEKAKSHFNFIQLPKDNIHKDFKDRKDIVIFKLKKLNP